jgi:glucose/arabinose dehydrogenase
MTIGAGGTTGRARRAAAIVFGLAVAATACVGDSGGEAPAGTGAGPASTGPAATTTTEPGGPSPTDEVNPRSAFDPTAVRLELRPVVDGLESPLLVASAGDTGRLFVVEQAGRIRVVEGGELLAAPFLDVSDRLVSGGEQGLLGLAFHPRFASNGRFFVNYTDLQGDTVISEFAVSAADPNRADAASERVLLRVDQPYANHNGGNLVFGPDGFLYVGMGDGGSGGDPMGNGQRLDTLLGKMLRIDVDARSDGAAYGIPPGNPFAQRDDARPEIWAYGMRNPWRFSFDRETGDLWIGDVGQSAWEEIDRVGPGDAGADLGWNVMEGRSCYQPASGCDESGLVLPVAVYGHDEGCSVTGGFVYRGTRWPALAGAYLFADYCSGTIWGLDAANPRTRPPAVLLETGFAVSSFGQDDSGELYVTDLGGGAVLQIQGPSA